MLEYRGRHKASVGEKYLGIFNTAADGWRAVDAYLINKRAREAEAGLTTLRLWGEVFFEERELAGVVRNTDKERSVWNRHVIGSEKSPGAVFIDWPMTKIQPILCKQFLEGLLRKKVTNAHVTKDGEIVYKKNKRTLSRKVVTNVRTLLKACFGQAVLNKQRTRLAANPITEDVVVPEIARVVENEELINHLELEEITKLFAILPDARRKAYFGIAIYAGLRDGEIIGLRWRDILLDAKRPTIEVRRSYDGATKTKNSRRNVPILNELRPYLRAWRTELLTGTTEETRRGAVVPVKFGTRDVQLDSVVFPAPGGGCYHDGYDCDWRHRSQRISATEVKVRPGWRARAGIRDSVTFHDLRHTCAAHLVMGSWGVKLDMYELSKWLGHSDIQVTQRYADLSPDFLHEKVARTNEAARKLRDQEVAERVDEKVADAASKSGRKSRPDSD